MRTYKALLFYQIWIPAKQKKTSSCKLQTPLDNICDEIFVDLIETRVITDYNRLK